MSRELLIGAAASGVAIPALFGVGDGVQVLEQPPLEQQDLPVDQGQNTAPHEQCSQVGGGTPWLQAVEFVVAPFDVAAAQTF